MAITATLALDRSTTTRTQTVRALITVSNSGANPVTILNVTPFMVNSVSESAPQKVPGSLGKVVSNVVIPASGSNTLTFNLSIDSPNPTYGYDTPPTQNAYNVGCLIYGDDGSVTSPTPQLLTHVALKNYGSF